MVIYYSSHITCFMLRTSVWLTWMHHNHGADGKLLLPPVAVQNISTIGLLLTILLKSKIHMHYEVIKNQGPKFKGLG